MRSFVHYIPIATTLLSVVFGWIIYSRYREKGGAHLAWWSFGIFMYGLGTLTESAVTLFGWNEFFFRSWYVAGALLGGAPLAQGTVYLMMPRRIANGLSVVLLLYVAVAASFVLIVPINYELVEAHRLTGAVMEWPRVRLFSPFVNIYAFIFLVGGAVVSALKYARRNETFHRMIGNVFIAVGAILPGIGGTATRMGYTEVLYVTELLGLILIWIGYRLNVGPGKTEPHLSGAVAPT